MSQTPRRFRPYRTGDESSPDAETQRIERGEELPWQDMVNPDWRSTRRRPDPKSRAGVNSQRLSRLMESGGWKFVAIGAVAVIVLFIVFLVSRNPNPQTAEVPEGQPGISSNLNQPGPIDTAQNPGGPINVDEQPTVPATNPEPEPVVQAQSGSWIVAGTGVEGLFLRDQPDGNILKTMPEGTLVEKLGEQQLPDRVWFNIRDTASGLEGWAAADFLQAAPPQ